MEENGDVTGGHFIGGRMVMLGMWSVLWRENGHFTEVLTLMDICIFCILWSIVVFCFLYTVYLTFKSPHLPLPLHPPYCNSFAYRGAGGLYACKKKGKYVKAEKGNDVLTNVWESMSV